MNGAGHSKDAPRSSSPRISLNTSIGSLDLKSPTMLASGILGISFDLFPRIINSGCGAIVTKSIGIEPREGYSNPTIVAVDSGYLNAIGLANPGAQDFEDELARQSIKESIPLVVSVFADSAEHFAELAKRFDRFDFLAYELNLSCPHVKQVGSEIGSDPSNAAEVVRQTKSNTSKPIFAKMPATILDVPEWARAVETAGADAIVAINTIRAMKIDIQSRRPTLSYKFGGLSGPAIKPVAVRCVYEIYENVRIPIVGVGGVAGAEDAIEFFLAGARAVQIGSAIGTDYLNVFSSVNKGVEQYLKSNGFSSVKEIVGLAHN